MKLGIINSAFGQAGMDTAAGLSHIARIGFDTVDIFTEAMTISKKEKFLIARTCEKNDLPIVAQRGINATPPLDQYAKGALFINTLRSIVNDDERWNKKTSRFHVIRRNDEDTNKP